MSNPTIRTNIPPPPPPLVGMIIDNNPKLKIDQQKFFNINECTWAEEWPELQKACYLNKVCTYGPPKCCRYRNIPSIIQEGPTCGLTALSMLLGGSPAAAELLETAKKRNYTNNGEMFSAKNLHRLICETVADMAPGGLSQIECQMYEGQLNCAKVRDCLLNDACVFVAYDPDFNNVPCLKYGHKAHWALVIGFLIDEMEEFHVIARHGKSKNLSVWSLKSLSASNSNLEEFSQPVGYPHCDFLVPEGGLGGKLGLKEQAIIVSGISNETLVVR